MNIVQIIILIKIIAEAANVVPEVMSIINRAQNGDEISDAELTAAALRQQSAVDAWEKGLSS